MNVLALTIEHTARALCTESTQAWEATHLDAELLQHKKKTRYATVEAYVNDHWRWWIHDAAIAVDAILMPSAKDLEEAVRMARATNIGAAVTLGDAVRAARGGDAPVPKRGFA